MDGKARGKAAAAGTAGTAEVGRIQDSSALAVVAQWMAWIGSLGRGI